MRGKLIVIEGTDCSGKETQAKLLTQKLKKRNIKVEHLSFPNYDTPTGRIIGSCYLGKEELCKKLQLVGLNIDRWHLYKIINGKVILKDFELIIICNILNLDMNELKKLIQI